MTLASFNADSVNVATWTSAAAVYLNRLNQPGWKVSKETMEREYGWLANQAVGNIGVFCLTVAEKVQWARKTNFVFGMQNWKNILFWQDIQWKNERSSFS